MISKIISFSEEMNFSEAGLATAAESLPVEKV